MIYQKFSDRLKYDIRLYDGIDFAIPHFHSSAELIYVENGEIEVFINGKAYSVSARRFVLILPNRLHYFKNNGKARFWVHLFQKSNAPEFFLKIANKRLDSPIFECSEYDVDFYKKTCLKCGCCEPTDVPSASEIQSTLSPLRHTSALYVVLDNILSEFSLDAEQEKNEVLFGKVLKYISDNYSENITLESCSLHLGYEAHYLCRRIKQITDINFRRLVNTARIEQAKILLTETDKSLASISEECGFGSIRTFNRSFKLSESVTPTEYRTFK